LAADIPPELAHFFGALGTKINIIQCKKYDVHEGYETEYVSRENNKFHVVVNEGTSGKSLEIVSDQLLIAARRIPNSDTLDLKNEG
jgi:pyruvate/2-oxoglutarate dehydrogenase complex dihydrolipoamide dehydrogenase (E3) component